MLKCKNKVIIPIILSILLSVISCSCVNKDIQYNVINENYVILRLAESQFSNYPSTQGDREFARLIELKSEGRIRVEVYDSAKLGEEASVIEQVQFGGIDLARVNLVSLDQYVPEIGIMTLPYMFRSSEHMWKVIEGSIGQSFKESLLKEKIACLCWYEGGAINFYNSKRDIQNVEDLKGLKISSQHSQPVMDAYPYLGISLLSTKSNDIYKSLQKGFIDGVEDNIITYYSSKYYGVAKYVTYDAHSYTPELIIASRTTMIQLPQSDQELIEEAAQESAVFQRKIWADMEIEAMEALKIQKIDITYPSEKYKKEFLAAVKPLYDLVDKETSEAITNTK